MRPQGEEGCTVEEAASMEGNVEGAPLFLGRARVMTRFGRIDESNVVEALEEALPAFGLNSAQISALWRYYKGDQRILRRKKEVRPEIDNRIVENHAQEIVAFKIGYQLSEPMQYTCRMQSDGDEKAYDERLGSVNELNTMMFAEDKASCDRDLFEWMCVGGIGYRMAEADTAHDVEDGGAPFEVYTLDPRVTCVVCSAQYHHRPLMAFWLGYDSASEKPVYNVYTDKMWFKVCGSEVVDKKGHTYGSVPIVEYRLNNARMGVFEPVIPLLDAINTIESDRVDDIEQVVQSLMVFKDCGIDAESYDAMREKGAVKIRSLDPNVKASIEMLNSPLDQTGTQTVKEDLYQSVVNICGMPNRNGVSGSSSDTGAAVLLRDGWTLAESHAKSYELQFKRSERQFLRVVLSICRQSSATDLDLRIRDIELAFNRRNYENILVKSQVLTTMLQTGKIHPQLAFQSCGLFTDPDAAYKQSAEWAEDNAPVVPPAPGRDDAEPVGSAEGPQAGVPQEGDTAA